MAHIDPAAAEKLFQTTPDEPVPVPANSPISFELREALTWLREHGVSECRLENIGSFTFRPPEPKSEPTINALDLTPKEDDPVGDPDAQPVVGGFNPSILFAHVDNRGKTE